MFKRDRARVILLCHALLDVRAPPMTTQGGREQQQGGDMEQRGSSSRAFSPSPRHSILSGLQPLSQFSSVLSLPVEGRGVGSTPPLPYTPPLWLCRWQRWEGRGAALHSARVGRESIGIGSSEIRPAQARRTEAGEQQATGAPGRAAGARAAGQQRRPHQRLRLQYRPCHHTPLEPTPPQVQVAGRGVGSTPTLPHAPPLWPCREEAPGGGLLRREAAGGAAAVLSSPSRYQLSAGSLGVCAVWPGLNQWPSLSLPHLAVEMRGAGVNTDASPRPSPVAVQGLVGTGGRQHCSMAIPLQQGRVSGWAWPLKWLLLPSLALDFKSQFPIQLAPTTALKLALCVRVAGGGEGCGVNTDAPSRPSRVAVQGGGQHSTRLGWNGRVSGSS
ncbi:unnamed protein product [Closterium sp. NIES-65]|nr:unnamed protein product [Closterium sp. NIES-65]